MASAIVAQWFFTNFDFTPIHYVIRTTFGSRVARPVQNYDNILLPFSFELWLAILATSVTFAVLFYGTHLIYESNFPVQRLQKVEKLKINFLLFTMSKITEPDPIPWFTAKWSTGRFLTMLWMIWSLIMVMCYNCNLRAHMTSPRYEKNLDTIQDVADNNRVTWLSKFFLPMNLLHLEKTGQTDGPLYQISKRGTEAGSFFVTAEHGGVSPRAIEVLWMAAM